MSLNKHTGEYDFIALTKQFRIEGFGREDLHPLSSWSEGIYRDFANALQAYCLLNASPRTVYSKYLRKVRRSLGCAPLKNRAALNMYLNVPSHLYALVSEVMHALEDDDIRDTLLHKIYSAVRWYKKEKDRCEAKTARRHVFSKLCYWLFSC